MPTDRNRVSAVIRRSVLMRLFQYLKQAFDGTVAQLELVGEAAVGEVRT